MNNISLIGKNNETKEKGLYRLQIIEPMLVYTQGAIEKLKSNQFELLSDAEKVSLLNEIDYAVYKKDETFFLFDEQKSEFNGTLYPNLNACLCDLENVFMDYGMIEDDLIYPHNEKLIAKLFKTDKVIIDDNFNRIEKGIVYSPEAVENGEAELREGLHLISCTLLPIYDQVELIKELDLKIMVKISVTGVKWDDAGDLSDKIELLLTQDDFNAMNKEDLEDLEDLEDYISDEISNKSGFCHFGWENYKTAEV